MTYAPAAPETAAACPKCGGQMWDNRASKRNPKSPDFKCRDKSCDGVIWPPRNGTPAAAAAPARTAAPAKEERSLGGPLPYEQGDPFVALTTLYRRCLDTAIAITAQTDALAGPDGVSPVIVGSVTSTLFIEANKRGIK